MADVPWRRSIRTRVWGAILAVVLAPLFFAWGAAIVSRVSDRSLEDEVRSAARNAGTSASSLVAVAGENTAWVTVLRRDGSIAREANRSVRDTPWERLTLPFMGPGESPSLALWERTQGSFSERSVVVEALAGRASSRCALGLEGALVVCEAASPLREEVSYARAYRVRAVRRLFDVRYQIAKLVLFVLVIGAALAWWLGRSAVRPLEALRAQVASRVGPPISLEPVPDAREDEVGDVARAFNRLLLALDARNRAYETFAADLAHELKNPVATVRAAAEALEGDAPLDAQRRERLARALAQGAQRLDALVGRFLELARAEAGLPDEPREEVALDDMVRALAERARNDPRYAQVRFEVSAAPTRVRGVAVRLEDAVWNVIDNAASFAGAPGEVRVGLAREGERAVLRCSDSGPGIADEDLPRVFERFFTTRKRSRGTGLGLSLTRAVVEAHRGRVTAASPPGSGAVFTIELPLSHDE